MVSDIFQSPATMGVVDDARSDIIRALVVDDSPTSNLFIRKILGPEFRCESASAAEEALAKARDNPPDVIISDVVMAPVDGHELCRRVRADPVLCHIPLILMTGNAEAGDRATGIEEGADDYLRKPVNPRELIARARSLARLARAQGEVRRKNEELASAHMSLLAFQRQAVENEKMAVLGTLSAGVAHEINNPLSFVKAGTEFVFEKVASMVEEGRTPAPETLNELKQVEADIKYGIQRITTIVRDLTMFARGAQRPPELVPVKAEIERGLNIARSRLLNVKVVLTCDEDLRIRAAPGYLCQLILNMVINAADALEGVSGARVDIRGAASSNFVEVVVEDNGRGIPKEMMSRVFQPFFTTKPAGKGTGLGLTICLDLVRRMGGNISVESEAGRTAFRVVVPSVGKPQAQEAVGASPSAGATH